VQGYRLAGVFEGSPAARAGLQKGDILVRLAGSEIVDLASFTRALRVHQPGDLVEAEVLRDGQRLRFTVVLGRRSERQ
jgi:S1-C subfamily serine protease